MCTLISTMTMYTVTSEFVSVMHGSETHGRGIGYKILQVETGL